MAMKRVPIADATAAQLREFARDALGLQEVKDQANKQTLIAQITPAWEHDFILVPEVAEKPARRSLKDVMAEETPDEHPDEVTVLIPAVDEPGGDRPVEVAVNGVVMLIPRNKDAVIPWRYYVALQNAEQHFHDPLPVVIGAESVSGGINPVPRIVKRYPFQRVA